MNTQLIMLDTPILVDTENLKDWLFEEPTNKIFKYQGENLVFAKTYKGIIAGIPSLPFIQFADKELEKEVEWVDINKLAIKEYPIILPKEKSDPNYDIYNHAISLQDIYRNIWIKGFKSAQSLNTKKYSEEDMRKAFIDGHSLCRCVTDNHQEALESLDEYMKSVQQPKIYRVEAVLENNVYIIIKILPNDSNSPRNPST